jgi:predicted CXXCH cytochrome family protein
MLLFAAQALYVGNAACGSCHAEISQAYAATPMARSSGAVTGGLPAGKFSHSESRTEYRVEPAGLVTAARGSLTMQRQLDYFIGSGAAGQSFVYSKDRFLFQAPITWYSQQVRWDVSPGYENDKVSRWNRPIEPECLNCHASQIRSSPAYLNSYADPPFAQPGIGCERCHGPGSDHIQGKGGMVNPAKLEPAKRDSVCAQCHMSGEVRVDRVGKRWIDYRPGYPLSDFAAYFVTEGASDLKATGYVEKLLASRCKLASKDKLWCGTCHDPHRVPEPAQRVAWYRTRCLSCHATSSCGRPGDCTACHMPKRNVVDVNHGVLTDHAIPRVPLTVATKESLWKLTPIAAEYKGDRELGLAYAAVFFRTGDLRQEKEAMRLLSATGTDPQVQYALANLYERRGDFSRAFHLYRSADSTPAFAPAFVNLGVYLGLSGMVKEAIGIWGRVLKQNPCAEEAGINLVRALEFDKNHDAVRRIVNAQAGCVF